MKCLVNYNDIINLTNQGYSQLGDLKLAIEGKLISEKSENIELYIDHKRKLIDIYDVVICEEVRNFGRKELVYYFL